MKAKKGDEMEQTVYADLLFLVNFSMDFLCFFLTVSVLREHLPLLRALGASALGGIYSVVSLFFDGAFLLSLMRDALAGLVMCAVVFGGRRRWRDLPFRFLLYTALSMALGGFMTAGFYLLNRLSLTEQISSVGGTQMPVWFFGVLALAGALTTLAGGRAFRRRASARRAEIEITYRGKKVRLRALADSGNLLREPVSGRPCVVTDIDAMGEILSPRIRSAARSGGLGGLAALSPEESRSIRVLPIRTAGGEGFLLALRVERIAVDAGRGWRTVDAVVALSDIGRGAEDAEALLPCELLD